MPPRLVPAAFLMLLFAAPAARAYSPHFAFEADGLSWTLALPGGPLRRCASGVCAVVARAFVPAPSGEGQGGGAVLSLVSAGGDECLPGSGAYGGSYEGAYGGPLNGTTTVAAYCGGSFAAAVAESAEGDTAGGAAGGGATAVCLTDASFCTTAPPTPPPPGPPPPPAHLPAVYFLAGKPGDVQFGAMMGLLAGVLIALFLLYVGVCRASEALAASRKARCEQKARRAAAAAAVVAMDRSAATAIFVDSKC